MIPRQGLGYVTVDFRFSWPHGETRRNRPPRFAHLTVEGGRLRDLPRPAPGARPRGPHPSLLASKRSQAILIARVQLGGRSGLVVLAPSFDRSSSIHGDHLFFLWRRGAAEYVVSLHAWSPLAESEAALRAVVESLPAG